MKRKPRAVVVAPAESPRPPEMDVADTVLTCANVVAGVFETLVEVAETGDLARASQHAIARGRRRARALRKERQRR